MPWERDVVDAVVAALTPMADPVKAPQMKAYMKDVAPFLGIQTPVRRRAVQTATRPFGQPPAQAALALSARALFARPEREFAYAACDLIAKNIVVCDAEFLIDPVEELLTTASWWDTVDSLGSGAVSPLCRHFPESRSVVLRWSASPDIWLVRAAIQHQRGWKHETDVPFVLSLCAAHAHESEFFVQKAIGWALRDIARLDPKAAEEFCAAHPGLTRVATREAERGLATPPQR